MGRRRKESVVGSKMKCGRPGVSEGDGMASLSHGDGVA